MPNLLVQITDEQAAWLDSRCDRLNPKSRLIRDLIDSARFKVDAPATLGAESSEAPSNTLSIPKSINKTKNKKEGRKQGRKQQIYLPEFETFWKAYQQLPQKASKQSKPLAFAAWQETCELYAADDLQRAVERQLKIQTDELRGARGFTVSMPDCFRWLRDECFVALLEDHKTSTEHVVEYL